MRGENMDPYYVGLAVGLPSGILLGRALQLVLDLRNVRKMILINPLCRTLKGCQERMQRECELSWNLGHLAGSLEGSRRHWDTLRTWGNQVFRPRVH
jgi:hypothetical protein